MAGPFRGDHRRPFQRSSCLYGRAAYMTKAMPGHEGNCVRPTSAACNHGTFVAGILVARRGSVAPGICPGCTLLLRPIFIDPTRGEIQPPSASPKELTAAIVESIEAGAWV